MTLYIGMETLKGDFVAVVAYNERKPRPFENTNENKQSTKSNNNYETLNILNNTQIVCVCVWVGGWVRGWVRACVRARVCVTAIE